MYEVFQMKRKEFNKLLFKRLIVDFIYSIKNYKKTTYKLLKDLIIQEDIEDYFNLIYLIFIPFVIIFIIIRPIFRLFSIVNIFKYKRLYKIYNNIDLNEKHEFYKLLVTRPI